MVENVESDERKRAGFSKKKCIFFSKSALVGIEARLGGESENDFRLFQIELYLKCSLERYTS